VCRDNNAFFKTFTPLLHSVMFLNATRRRLFWIKHSHYFFLTFRVDLFVCGQIIIWMDVWTDKENEEVNERIDREIDRVIILTRSHILQTFIRNCLFSSVLTHTMLISSCVVFVICCCRHRYESIFITSWRFPFKLNYGKSGCFFLILFSLR